MRMTGSAGAGSQVNEIDFTAGLMQSALMVRKIEAIVSPVFDGPQVTVFGVSLALGTKPEMVENLDGALAMAAGAKRCRIARDEGRLLVEIPKPPAERKVLTARRLLRVKPPSAWHVPVGIGMTGKVVWFNLADERMCHTVLGGTTRSGKTNLLHWILFRLLSQNPGRDLQLVLLDPKGAELQPFASVRHLIHPPQHLTGEIVKVLMWVDQEMKRRAVEGIHEPRVLIVIDEVRNLVRADTNVSRLLNSIGEMAAAEGIHLMVTTQQPGAKALGEALANFPCRFLGRVSSRTLEYGAAGRGRSQAADLLGRGDFLRITQDGITRLQVPLVDRAMLGQLPQAREVPRLELGTFVDARISGQSGEVDARGGWQRKDLDMDEVIEAIEGGMTASQLGREFGINFHRAERLIEQFGGDDGD